MKTRRFFETRLIFGKFCVTTLAMVILLDCGPLCAQGKKPPKDDGGGDDPPAATLPTFTYQSLGTLGGATSTAEGINLWGEVVGNTDLSDGSSVPYLYTPTGGMKNLNVITEGPLDVPARTLFGPDGRFYVLNTGLYAGGGSVAVFDPATGEFLGMFILVGSGGLENPADMAFGPDGNLYIPSHSGLGTPRNRILQFNGQTGEYIDEFVTADAGAEGITQLLFGPDVNDDGVPDLFVCSLRTEEILIFDGVTGDRIDVLLKERVSRFQLRNRVDGPELLRGDSTT